VKYGIEVRIRNAKDGCDEWALVRSSQRRKPYLWDTFEEAEQKMRSLYSNLVMNEDVRVASIKQPSGRWR